jgi:cytoskeletal protein CcmA (bactofilin family)
MKRSRGEPMNEKKIDENKLTGFFDKDTEIKGDLSFEGSFRIDGRFTGKINSNSVLIVGDNGKVDADIKVGNIIINGEVKGTVEAKEKIEISASARVIGTVIAPKLEVEEGAYLETNCQITDQVSLHGTEEKVKEVLQPTPEKKPDSGFQT